jgi:SAM-dependent methyltransferase
MVSPSFRFISICCCLLWIGLALVGCNRDKPPAHLDPPAEIKPPPQDPGNGPEMHWANSNDEAVVPIAELPGFGQGVPDNLNFVKPERLPAIESYMDEFIAADRPLHDYQSFIVCALDALTFRSNDVIADIGAGTGIFEIGLLERGVPFKEAYAVDPDALSLDLLTYLLKKGAYRDAAKVKVVPSSFDDVRLPLASIDRAVLIRANWIGSASEEGGNGANDRNTVPQALASLRRALKPTGQIDMFASTEHQWKRTADDDRFLVPLESAGFQVVSVADANCSIPLRHYVLKVR